MTQRNPCITSAHSLSGEPSWRLKAIGFNNKGDTCVSNSQDRLSLSRGPALLVLQMPLNLLAKYLMILWALQYRTIEAVRLFSFLRHALVIFLPTHIAGIRTLPLWRTRRST